ncbi:D-alanyl-D-alanine carboxypeptidase family protein [Candidatus Saccharibacteria bacterium]|nr:D-alanyl-D-alanine carboxypeptidase family protein [Candidatus Saccharibacteria bacterium]
MYNRSNLVFPIACLLLVAALVFHAFMQSDDVSAAELEKDAFEVALNPSRDYLILVNKDHEYKFGRSYDVSLKEDLIYATDCYRIPTLIEPAASLAFGMLRTRLHVMGYDIELFSAYRTKKDQQWVVEMYGNDEEWTKRNTVLQPGYSEHHTGLTLSFMVWLEDDVGVGDWCEETSELREKLPELDAIRNQLADFGFIERYPAGKEDITGVKYAPYEIRFVGSSKVAHEIMDNNLCLEEYLEEQESEK